jgi:CspA family cold shock protein
MQPEGRPVELADNPVDHGPLGRILQGQRLSLSRKAMAASMNGTIKRLVSDKGFGFILADDGNEYFFHNSACQGTRFDELREGQAVTFEKGQGPKGPRGENVRVS